MLLMLARYTAADARQLTSTQYLPTPYVLSSISYLGHLPRAHDVFVGPVTQNEVLTRQGTATPFQYLQRVTGHLNHRSLL